MKKIHKLIPATVFFMSEDKAIPPAKQAQQIIAMGEEYVKKTGATGFCITFSANKTQTDQSYRNYCDDEKVKITGRNQAETIAAIMAAIPPQMNFRVLPISTCLYPGGHGKVETTHIVDCLASIACYLGAQVSDHGEYWVLLGLKNQLTGNGFAIGGGTSKQLSTDQNNLIQATLRYFESGNFSETPAADSPIAKIFSKLKGAYELGEETGDPLAYAFKYIAYPAKEEKNSKMDVRKFKELQVESLESSPPPSSSSSSSSSSAASSLSTQGMMGTLKPKPKPKPKPSPSITDVPSPGT